VPCLDAADRYDRAAGYFTSEALPILARGLHRFLDGRGRMRIVCSPMLTQADADAIERATRTGRRSAGRCWPRRSHERRSRYRDATELLAWMVSEGILDIRIAMPSHGQGIYHEKFGLFSHAGTDFVAFVGSPNETAGGILSNFEQIAVFVTGHGSREQDRIDDLRANFDRLWADDTPNLDVFPFPEAARRALLEFRPATKPRPPSGTRDLHVDLFPHQVDAIRSWEQAGRRGILEMATGTGKTVTALAATRPLARDGHLIVVLVPGVDLMGQWEEVVRSSAPTAAVQLCGGASDWPKALSGFLQRWRIQARRPDLTGDHDSHYVIATMDTAASERFQRMLRGTGRSVLVVDEAHRAGSRVRRRALDLPASARLGLSATPERPWDDEGERAIADGIGPTCFTYGLQDAIRDGYLTPYRYEPSIVTLTEDERDAYAELSEQLTEAFGSLTSRYPQAGGDLRRLLQLADAEEAMALQLLLFRRADIIKSASAKLELVRSIADREGVTRCLIYCNDEEQVGEVVQVLQAARRSFGVFTTARLVQDQRRTVLRDFEEGRFDFLVSIRCLDEGIDVPGAAHALIVASSKTEREFVQRRGRVLRRAPGKELSTIHDPIVLPVTLDADGYPLGALSKAEESIVSGELHRAQLFADAAVNSTEATSELQRARALTRQAV
jgi:superfamily II DNA or RNA helicase